MRLRPLDLSPTLLNLAAARSEKVAKEGSIDDDVAVVVTEFGLSKIKLLLVWV